MRLLSTSSWRLEDFTDNEIPKYAILSHRWEKEEITFQDLQLRATESATKKGWSKLRGCVEQAVKDGFEWVWIDTCCIDKSSSAELSEAINSMFNWYKEAQVCYAYLSDVLYYPQLSGVSLEGWEVEDFADGVGGDGEGEENSTSEDGEVDEEEGEEGGGADEYSSFRSSNWFTRGWTLQELLAPSELVFFDSHWRTIGERNEIWELVKEITGINVYDWRRSSVAQKMSWASKRETTRIEDRAYSLMGLFGVNMPPLYGEREKAFIRLQLEILRISDDESIFAWRDSNDLSGGLLALSPNAFQLSGSRSRLEGNDQPPYWMTNKGLCMERQLLRPKAYSINSDDTFILPLQCSQGFIQQGIVLKYINGDQFARVSSGKLLLLEFDAMEPEAKRTVYIRQTGDGFGFNLRNFPTGYKFVFPTMPLLSKGFAVTNQYASSNPTNIWENIGGEGSTRQLAPLRGDPGGTGALEFTRLSGVDLTPLKPPERILVIFNVCYNRSRMAVYRPNNDLSLDRVMANLVEPGDWMAKKDHLFGPLTLKNGEGINCELIKMRSGLNSWDSGHSQTYQANISLSESATNRSSFKQAQ
jgi:hypothetical protein